MAGSGLFAQSALVGDRSPGVSRGHHGPASAGSLVVVSGPDGEEDARWVEAQGLLPVERSEALLFVPRPAKDRVTWRMARRTMLLGDHVVSTNLTGRSSAEVCRALQPMNRPTMARPMERPTGWVILDAAALDAPLVTCLGRRSELRLAILCPLGRPCPLPSLRPLGAVLVGLSMKEATLTPATAMDLGSLGRLRHLSFRGARLPADFWGSLSRLRRLVALDLAGADPASWAPIPSSLSRLQWLDLSFSLVPIQLLAALAELPGLRSLRLASTPLRDADLHVLEGCPSLVELDISLTSVGDAGMVSLAALEGLSGLRALDLRHTRVTDLGIQSLAELPDLRLLHAPPGMTDLGLRWLDRLHHLEGLSLRGTQVTGEGLKALESLPRLCWLDLPRRR